MVGFNLVRVTVDSSNEELDLFSRSSLIEVQSEGGQIVQTRCGHFMAEAGFTEWAQTILNRSGEQNRAVDCPICRTNLMDHNFEMIELEGVQINRDQRRKRQESILPVASAIVGFSVIYLASALYLFSRSFEEDNDTEGFFGSRTLQQALADYMINGGSTLG